MSELIEMTKVFIIESPSFVDIFEKRKEGYALGKILELATIDNEIYAVSDLETLRMAFGKISSSVNEIKGNLGAIHLHFSMHGSENGVALSDKTFVDWRAFYDVLKVFNDSIGYISPSGGQKIAPTYLAFSVCYGFSAKKIKDFGDESPYTALIGPTQPVSWADSLLAFSVYYQNTILKRLGVRVALTNMNKIIGLNNIFQSDPGKGIQIK